MNKDEHLYDELCLSIYNTNRYFHHLYGYVLEKYDLSYLQYMSLLIIYKQTSVKLMDIGAELELSSNTLTPVIEKLVNKSWIIKVQSSQDRRVKVLKMSDQKVTTFERILYEIRIMRDNLIHQSGCPIEEVLRENQALNQVLKKMIQEKKRYEDEL
ncbi:MAG: MarR family transcriptional regulator [Leuconostoc mesenteroides]|uniref:MarR family winged helix-turn-helix transcriptional regulator n=1 Tax=Leuconostoc mesenteroides TaxID=1245 RepID=UPI002955B713|nr:MarR family transcriptional regulator [Leuconostoc mesenteroides]MDV7738617.1 MarR family transcriptional regulator [Leuconostoc mesenteroides]